MSKKLLIPCLLLFVFSALLIAMNKDAVAKDAKHPDQNTAQMVARGAYLVTVAGCDDCHSPKKMGAKGPELIPELRLSGYPSNRPIGKAQTSVIKDGWIMFGGDLTSAVGPWGMSFTANLTPDATGIGSWKESQFIKAIREGKYKGLDNTRPLLPPMPWQAYKNMTDEDLKSVFAFLKTMKPVKNVVPAPRPLASL